MQARKIILVVSVLLLAHCGLRAQRTYIDIVELKNKSLLKGYVLQRDSLHAQLQLLNGSKLQVANSDIASMEKRGLKKIKASGPHNTFLLAERGFMHSMHAYLSEPFGIEIINGFRFRPELYLAGGCAAQIHVYRGDRTLPVFVSVGGDFMRTEFTPTYELNAGYAFPTFTKDTIVLNRWFGSGIMFARKGGVFFQAGIGLKIRAKKNVAFSLRMAYHLEGFRNTENWFVTTTEQNETLIKTGFYHRLQLKIGYTF